MSGRLEEEIRRRVPPGEWTQCIELVEDTCTESQCAVCDAPVGTCCRHCLHVLAAGT